MIHLDDIGEQTGDGRRSHTMAVPIALTTILTLVFLTPLSALAAPSAGFQERAPLLAERIIQKYGDMIDIAALLHDEDENLIASVIVVESEGNPTATSKVGAKGLMQLMPPTAKAMGAKDPTDPLDNILAGTKYIKHLKEDYGFTTEEALVAYNMGPTRAKRWLSQYDPEDNGYAQKVLYVFSLLEEEKENVPEKTEVAKKSGVAQAISAITEGAAPMLTKPRALSSAFPPIGVSAARRPEIVTE